MFSYCLTTHSLIFFLQGFDKCWTLSITLSSVLKYVNILSATNLDYVTPYTILTFTFRVDWKRLCWTLGQEPYLYLARSFCLLFPIILHTPRGISISLSKKKKKSRNNTLEILFSRLQSLCFETSERVTKSVYILIRRRAVLCHQLCCVANMRLTLKGKKSCELAPFGVPIVTGMGKGMLCIVY